MKFNLFFNWPVSRNWATKAFLIMRMTLFIIILSVTQIFAIDTYSQNAKINLNIENKSVKDVLSEIQNQSEFFFMFNSKLVDVDRKVSIQTENELIGKVLDKLFDNTDITYTVVDKQIVLTSTKLTADQQQTKTLTGKVTDNSGVPLPGATVIVQGTTVGVVTNADGNFSISVPENTKTITISFIGMKNQVITIGKKTTFEIILESDVFGIEEVVAIGYGTVKKELLMGSVGTVKMDDVKRNLPTMSAGNLLAGQMAGVKVSTPRGIPGSEPTITIRQSSSWNAQKALFVIDGRISTATDFNNIAPNDIENVTVLKDAASTAVYGSRAAAGVIVVTTRQGSKTAKAKIEYSFNTGTDRRTKNAPLTSAVETGLMYNRINAVTDWTESDIEYFKNINNGWGYDQLETVWRNPSTTTHNLSASGGTDKVRYYIGGSIADSKLFLLNLDQQNYNFRTNISTDLTDKVTLQAGISLNTNNRYAPNDYYMDDLYGKLRLWQPDQPVWTTDGNPIDYGWIQNMGAQTRGDNGYSKTSLVKPILNIKGTYRLPLIQGLSISAQYNKAFSRKRDRTFIKSYDMWVMKKTGNHIISTDPKDLIGLRRSHHTSYLMERNTTDDDYQLNFQLNYENTFNNVHNVKAWMIYEKYEANTGGALAYREKFPVYLTDQWWAASDAAEDVWANGNTEQPTGRKSWIGQFFYDYSGKYLTSFAYRYDGSMQFAPEERWGFFPSGSLGWIISKEKFMNSVNWIDMLKLRVSAGLTGNDAVGGWQWQQTYQKGNKAYFGTNGGTDVGIKYGSLVNQKLTWEKTLNYNLGVDVDFLKHFNFTAEYYYNNTYDILGSRIQSVPPTFSRSLPASNYGEVHGQGVEFSMGYKGNSGDLSFYANAMASYGYAEYISRDENITYPYQKSVGRRLSRIVTRLADHILRTQEDLDAFMTANPTYKYYGYVPQLGQMTYKDIAGPDGKPDGIIDDWDKKEVKKDNDPIVVGLNTGLSWKGIRLDATFNGYLKYYQYNSSLAGNVEWNRNWINWYNDSWTPENPNASLPKKYSSNDGTRRTTNDESTFWLKNSNFLRLKYVNLSYDIPYKYTSKIGLSNLNIYFNGTNLFVLSKFNKDYYDPEIGSHANFPVMKSYNFGFKVTL